MNAPFWRNKRVLITGHTGFKGSWLGLWLQSLGARVAGYALDPPTTPSLFRLARLDDVVESTRGDVRDLDGLVRAVDAFSPEMVFHMAAQSVVLRGYQDPVDTYSTNVVGTVHVLEAIRRLRGGCTVVSVTTDKCYANKGWLWGYRENDSLGGRDPYSSSKACAELVGQAYRESFFPPAEHDRHRVGMASARAGNVIGGGDWTPHQLIPDAVSALMRGEPVVLRHPEAVRPWQHVLDCLHGYISLGEALASDVSQYSGEWNFGPGETETRPVSYIVEGLAKHWSVGLPWVRDVQAHAPEERELRLDSSKARIMLGWLCRWPLDTALEWVARWYDGYRAGEDPRALCLEQIAAYTTWQDQ